MSTPAADERTLFQFTTDTDPGSWEVQDDVVMGGRSEGHFEINEAGNGRFWGHVSLDNDGGFSSIQTFFDEPKPLEGLSSFQLRLRGDGKSYTFRVQGAAKQDHWHEFTFPTKGDEQWETISIPFDAMTARYHGEPVDVPNFQGGEVHAFQFLIGNGKEQHFEAVLDWIGGI